jgi:DNA polymerase-4
MNAFFISCEMTRNPSLVGIPAAVAGDPKKRTGIILAANYEARACGVKTTMVIHEALKLCPKLTLIPPDHHFYGQKSEEVMDLLSNYTPALEQNSIDEAWLDMTGSEGLFGKPFDSAQ